MKKIILFLGFIGCCFALFSQNPICVDGSASGSENGTPSNPYHTIQAAVNAASTGDVIKVAKGTYSQAVQISQKKVQLLGGFAGSGDFDSANPQANVTNIKGTSDAPCVLIYIDKEISGLLIISGFTIRDGQRGIELTGGWSSFLDNITIENNIIENNGSRELDEWGSVQRGGGISLEGKNVTIQNNLIRNNISGRGAAIGCTDNVVNTLIADNRIENNKGYNDHAGGVSIAGTGTITRNIFDGNVIDAGGEFGYGYGGAILIFNSGTTFTLSYNVYRNNYAPLHGGAVFVDDGAKVTMEHELLYNNKSKESGSAIFVDADPASTLDMNHCTVSGNSTDNSGKAAIYVVGSIVSIQNSIIWNNGSDFEAVNDGPSLPVKLTVNYTLTQQGFTGIGNISPDPLFADAVNGDFHVKSKNGRFNPSTGQFVIDDANSPAIDAGNPSSDYSQEPQPNGGRVNLGRYGNTAEASKSAPAGIEENTQILWTVFPNPAKESITIGNLPCGSSVIITDITGKIVYSSVIKKEQITIGTANFENGVYIIQIANNSAVTHRKLIVSK